MSVDSNFNFLCGRPHGAWPPDPVHMRPPEPIPSPLRVDVINGWPLWKFVQSLVIQKNFQSHDLEMCSIFHDFKIRSITYVMDIGHF